MNHRRGNGLRDVPDPRPLHDAADSDWTVDSGVESLKATSCSSAAPALNFEMSEDRYLYPSSC
jgi:hypothetical protein